MDEKVQQLEVNFMELKKDIGYIKNALDKNDDQHKEIIEKIDHLSDTFQDKIQTKASQNEVIGRFDKIEKGYVTKETFNTVQKIVYGMAGAILLAFVYAVIESIIK